MNRRIRIYWGFLWALCLGCESGPEIASVEGTVTMDGKPLANATVLFVPENGRPAGGRTDERGHYLRDFHHGSQRSNTGQEFHPDYNMRRGQRNSRRNTHPGTARDHPGQVQLAVRLGVYGRSREEEHCQLRPRVQGTASRSGHSLRPAVLSPLARARGGRRRRTYLLRPGRSNSMRLLRCRQRLAQARRLHQPSSSFNRPVLSPSSSTPASDAVEHREEQVVQRRLVGDPHVPAGRRSCRRRGRRA